MFFLGIASFVGERAYLPFWSSAIHRHHSFPPGEGAAAWWWFPACWGRQFRWQTTPCRYWRGILPEWYGEYWVTREGLLGAFDEFTDLGLLLLLHLLLELYARFAVWHLIKWVSTLFNIIRRQIMSRNIIAMGEEKGKWEAGEGLRSQMRLIDSMKAF